MRLSGGKNLSGRGRVLCIRNFVKGEMLDQKKTTGKNYHSLSDQHRLSIRKTGPALGESSPRSGYCQAKLPLNSQKKEPPFSTGGSLEKKEPPGRCLLNRFSASRWTWGFGEEKKIQQKKKNNLHIKKNKRGGYKLKETRN